MDNGQNLARARHLEDVANGAKRYILAEILDVTNAVAAELANVSVSGGDYADFTGATSSVDGGTNGLVPAPSGGDQTKFLRGDGTWAVPASSVNPGVILSSVVSGVEGGLWRDFVSDTPVLKLRHGNFEYNFNCDDVVYAGDASFGGAGSTFETLPPDTYILGTDSVSSEGGLWYEVADVANLKYHSGNFIYSLAPDSMTYKGSNAAVVSYLPFTSSPTADALGNIWTPYGNPIIEDSKLKLDGSSYLVNSNVSALIGTKPWTIELWGTFTGGGADTTFFSTYNANVATSGTAHNSWISLWWNNGTPTVSYYYVALSAATISVGSNERHHYAFTYDGTTIRMFIDGVLSCSETKDLSLGGIFVIGADSSFGNKLIGTIDHFRIWKAALWTSNFTPPTASDYL